MLEDTVTVERNLLSILVMQCHFLSQSGKIPCFLVFKIVKWNRIY